MLGIHGERSLRYGSPINWAAPLNQGLVRWWKVLPWWLGGGTWRDLTTLAPGTLVTGTRWSSQAGPGAEGSLKFDGATGRITTPTLTHNIGTGDFTWAVWTNVTVHSVEVNFSALMALTTEPGLYATVTGGQWGLYWGGTSRPSGQTLPFGQWFHLAVVRRAGTIIFFRNGVQMPTTYPITTSMPNAILVLGDEATAGTTAALNGFLDDVRIMRRGLSAADVQALYTASLRGYPQELQWNVWPPAWGLLGPRKAPPPPRRAWRVFRKAA